MRIQTLTKDLNLKHGKHKVYSTLHSPIHQPFVSFPIKTQHSEKKDTEIELIIGELEEGRNLSTVDPKDMNTIISHLKLQKKEAMQQGDNQSTQLLEDLIQEVNSCIYKSTYQSIQDSKITTLKFKLLEAKSDFKAADEYLPGMEEEFINEYNSALGSLNHQHNQQFESFDNIPDVLPVSYCKACAHALQLGEQERHLCMRAFVYISMLDYLIHQIIKNLISQFLNTHYLSGKKIVLYTHTVYLAIFQKICCGKCSLFSDNTLVLYCSRG